MPILLIKVNDAPVDEGPDRYRAREVIYVFPDDHVFGAKEIPEAGNFYHVQVTDKTDEEASIYFQPWRHEPTVEQIAANGNNRLIEVTSTMVSVTGKNAFTQAIVQPMFDSINAQYPTANATYQSHTNTSFRFSITAPVAARDEIIKRIYEMSAAIRYRRRRWWFSLAGMAYLASNGGYASGTASQVLQYLDDGLQS